MPFPREAMSQQHLVSHLRDAIDRVRYYDEQERRNRTEDVVAKLIAAEVMLDSLIALNQAGVASGHVRHNIGNARAVWLDEFRRTRSRVASSS